MWFKIGKIGDYKVFLCIKKENEMLHITIFIFSYHITSYDMIRIMEHQEH